MGLVGEQKAIKKGETMSYKLENYTEEEKTNFILQHNHTNHLSIAFSDNAIYALEPYEALVDGEVVDRTNDADYKFQQFQNLIQYQHDAFDEFSREIIYQIQYNTALGNTTLVTSLQAQLQAEQQAVIDRINAITEAYNNEST